MPESRIDRTKNFVRKHQLKIVIPITAAVSFAVANNLKVSGVQESIDALVENRDRNTDIFRHFLKQSNQTEAFYTFLDAHLY